MKQITNTTQPNYKIEQIDNTSFIFVVQDLGIYLVELDFDKRDAKQGTGCLQTISWMIGDQETVCIAHDYFARDIESSMKDMILGVEEGGLARQTHLMAKMIIENWEEVPQYVQNTYDELSKIYGK